MQKLLGISIFTILVMSILALSCVSGCATSQTGASLDSSIRMASAKAIGRQPTQGPAAYGIGAAAKRCKCEL